MKSMQKNNYCSSILHHFLSERLCQGLSSILLLTASLVPVLASAQDLSRHYEEVLGTSLDISIYVNDQSNAEAAIDAAVAEIARLEQALSTYREDSELMQLNLSRSSDSASQALLDVLASCEEWIDRSQGTFSCRLGQVIDFWDAAEEAQQVPTRNDALAVARAARIGEISIDANSIRLDEGIDVEPSGLAKGYIIDKGMEVLRRELPEAAAIKLDIGGDSVYWGTPPGEDGWDVMVADPKSVSDNDNFISSLSLNSKAIATSGHDSRTRQILMREFSHIIIPQSGWPVFNGIYTVVIADDAITADAVATSLSVLNTQDALTLVESLPGIEALMIDKSGSQVISSGWNQYLSEELQQLNNANFNLTLDYSVPSREGNGTYHRPYVAIWISDIDEVAIKNLLLLGTEERWAGTNSRWWRRAGRRSTLEKNNVTRPTRAPGEYTLTWDGRDDNGNLLQPGTYLLHVEASREDGGHNHRSVEFTMSEGSQSFEQDRFGEVGAFKVNIEMSLQD
jgi:thiamine biosynthesis lipoprotein